MPRLNRAILEKIVALSPEAVLVADLRRPGIPILFANPALEELLGLEADAADGQEWAFFLDQEGVAGQLAELTALVSSGSSCQMIVPAAGGCSQFKLKLLPLPGRQGRARHMLVQVEPVPGPLPSKAEVKVELLERELDRAREANAKLGRRDPDSGLLRYGYFLELCQRDFALCARQRRELAMLTFTVREFDVYRETFGDKAAQSCLRMVGGRIAGALRRAGDLCARLDDASFVALITGHSYEEAVEFAEHIAAEVRRLALHHPRARGERYVTCRVGLEVGIPMSRDRPEDFVQAARECEEGAVSAGEPAA